MYKIRIHTKKPTERNPQVVVAAFLDSYGSIGTYSRTFRHKGIDPHCILERDMTAAEIEYTKKCWRLHWIAYNDWKGLIIDEWLTTHNREWVEQLLKASGLKESLDEILQNLKSK